MPCIRRWRGRWGCHWGLRPSSCWRERLRCAACRFRWPPSCMDRSCANWRKKGSGLVNLYVEGVNDLVVDIPEKDPILSFSQIERVAACAIGNIGLVCRNQLPGGVIVRDDFVQIIGLGQENGFDRRLHGKGLA